MVARAELKEKGVEVGEIESPFHSPRGEIRITDADGYALVERHA